MHTGDWPTTVGDALAVQERLRGRVDLTDDLPELPPTVTGLAYSQRFGLLETPRRTDRAALR
ncbi:hypothetical protein [Amycolatopsis sp. NPDC051061]|uniref:hypothetical protein n=1 Tax=Amycolatopsis sp. NPDC051061 TaxID=3155042 RepID=UPI00343F9C7A